LFAVFIHPSLMLLTVSTKLVADDNKPENSSHSCRHELTRTVRTHAHDDSECCTWC